jgi:hypothetical protein
MKTQGKISFLHRHTHILTWTHTPAQKFRISTDLHTFILKTPKDSRPGTNRNNESHIARF